MLFSERYVAVAKMSFLRFAAYKADIVIHFFTYPVAFIAFFFFVTGAFSQGLGQTGYTVPQLLTYYSVAWMLRMINHHGADISIGQSILSGNIAGLLVKPIDHHHYRAAEVGGKIFGRIIFYSFPALILLLFFVKRFLFAWDMDFARFIVLAIVGCLINFEIQYIIGCTAFFITVNHQVVWVTDMVIRLISGLIIPLSLFPSVLKTLLALLPFQSIYYLPIQAWIGKLDAPGFNIALATGLVWLAILYLFGKWVCSMGLRRFTIYGG